MQLIIEISEPLHTKLKMKAASKKISMRELITPFLEKIAE